MLVPALKEIKGVGMVLAHAVCRATNINTEKRVGDLTDSEISKLEDAVKMPLTYGIPTWMLNRRRDPETGEDNHLLTNDLAFAKEQDIKLLRRIKCYRGVRHAVGLPCRGQRTKSNFRPLKGKVQKAPKKGKGGRK
jgi:small subunit ribosomal protein S13